MLKMFFLPFSTAQAKPGTACYPKDLQATLSGSLT